MHQAHTQSAFSLVELSIVLVILGLLVGGVLGGQTLIRAAELRNVGLEFDSHKTAINSFRVKYSATPGDMANATRFWGRADDGTFTGQCASPATDQGTGTQTCNGNGNGLISHSGNEQFRFWQHLANAGLVAGTFTGVAGPAGTSHHEPGKNSPGSKVGGLGWGFNEGGRLPPNVHASYFTAPHLDANNTFIIGSPSTLYGPEEGAFTPEEVWNIDTKLDDGKPGTGIIIVRPRHSCTTATTSAQATDLQGAEYALDTNTRCAIMFPHAF